MQTPAVDILPRLRVSTAEIHLLCQRWKVAEMALFGSVLRDDFGPESDVDVLVQFTEDAPWSLLDLAGLKMELEDLFGREVDLVERSTVEKSYNWIRREAILGSFQSIFEQ